MKLSINPANAANLKRNSVKVAIPMRTSVVATIHPKETAFGATTPRRKSWMGDPTAYCEIKCPIYPDFDGSK